MEEQQHLDRLVRELKSRQQQSSGSQHQDQHEHQPQHQHSHTILITGANRCVFFSRKHASTAIQTLSILTADLHDLIVAVASDYRLPSCLY